MQALKTAVIKSFNELYISSEKKEEEELKNHEKSKVKEMHFCNSTEW